MSRSDRGDKSKPNKLRGSGPSKSAVKEGEDGNQGANKSEREVKGSPDVPVVPQVIDTGNTELSANTKGQQGKPEPKPRDWMTTFTGLLVFVGFLTIVLMGVQSYQNSAVITATIDANQIARSAFLASQRAWVAPHEVMMTERSSAKDGISFIVTFKNVGHEPAKNVVGRMTYFASVDSSKEPAKDGACNGLEIQSQNYVVAYPSDTITYRTFFDVPELKSANMSPIEYFKKVSVIYLWGCYNYSTVETVRRSEFCFKIDPISDKLMAEWPWTFCPTGNDGN